jgi:hypothetical protein
VRKIIAIAGIAGLSLGLAAIPAGAGNNADFVSTPESGPPGTVIHASDHNFNCDAIEAAVHVRLISEDTEDTIAEADTFTGNDATWDVDLTVPADAAPGAYVVDADCTDGEFRVFYNDNPFTVTEPVATTTTTSTTVAAAAETTTTTTTIPAVVVTPAATPVVASPALTG